MCYALYCYSKLILEIVESTPITQKFERKYKYLRLIFKIE